MRRLLPVYVATGASLGVILAYLIAGGASYKPLQVADPCEPRSIAVLAERGVFEGIALSALDGAACELQVSREELLAALADEQALAEFAEEHDLDAARIEDAVRAGLVRAVDDAELEGLIPGPVASLARLVAENAPVSAVIELFSALPGDPTVPELLEAISSLGLDLGSVQDQLQGLLEDGLQGLQGLEGREGLEDLLPDSGPGGLDGLGDLFEGELPELDPEQLEQLPSELRDLLPQG